MQSDPLSATLSALADPTRRGILAQLAQGDATVGELALPYPMTLAAVSKHLKVLESAGLISRSREAQWRHCHLEARPLKAVAEWAGGYEKFWKRNSDSLGAYLDQNPKQGPNEEEEEQMSTQTEIPQDEPIIIMTRVYDAPRDLVWSVMTEPAHVKEWWGGPGFTNPVCEMDVRPGGTWRHVMRFPDGFELHMSFVFVTVERPNLLVWRHEDHGTRKEGPPAPIMTMTLESLGEKTRWKLVAQFASMEDRIKAQAIGFTNPIEASGERLTAYLPTLRHPG